MRRFDLKHLAVPLDEIRISDVFPIAHNDAILDFLDLFGIPVRDFRCERQNLRPARAIRITALLNQIAYLIGRISRTQHRDAMTQFVDTHIH